MAGVPTALAAIKDPTISPPNCNPRIVSTENRPAEEMGGNAENRTMQPAD